MNIDEYLIKALNNGKEIYFSSIFPLSSTINFFKWNIPDAVKHANIMSSIIYIYLESLKRIIQYVESEDEIINEIDLSCINNIFSITT